MPSDWKLVDMMPAATIPAAYSWEAVTPVFSTLSWKIEAKRARKTMGKAKVKIIASRWRTNCLISSAPRLRPRVQAPGSALAAAAARPPVVAVVAVVLIGRPPAAARSWVRAGP